MSAYFHLLTLAIAAGVGATNTSAPLCSVDIPKSFPLALRPTTALSVQYPFPQLVVSNSDFMKSPVLPKHIAKEPLSNVSDPTSDSVKMEMLMMEVVGWTLIRLLAIGFAFLLTAEPDDEVTLAEAVAHLKPTEEEQSEEEQFMNDYTKKAQQLKDVYGPDYIYVTKIEGMVCEELKVVVEPWMHPSAYDSDDDMSDDDESNC